MCVWEFCINLPTNPHVVWKNQATCPTVSSKRKGECPNDSRERGNEEECYANVFVFVIKRMCTLFIQSISWSLLVFVFVFSFCILYLYLYFYFVHCLFRSVVGVYLHFQHLELELLFPCSSCKVHLPPSLSITSQKELNKTKLVKTSSSTFYPFETLQIDEVALISLSGSADKEKVLFF